MEQGDKTSILGFHEKTVPDLAIFFIQWWVLFIIRVFILNADFFEVNFSRNLLRSNKSLHVKIVKKSIATDCLEINLPV